jgi:hypothetical protein
MDQDSASLVPRNGMRRRRVPDLRRYGTTGNVIAVQTDTQPNANQKVAARNDVTGRTFCFDRSIFISIDIFVAIEQEDADEIQSGCRSGS